MSAAHAAAWHPLLGGMFIHDLNGEVLQLNPQLPGAQGPRCPAFSVVEVTSVFQHQLRALSCCVSAVEARPGAPALSCSLGHALVQEVAFS